MLAAASASAQEPAVPVVERADALAAPRPGVRRQRPAPPAEESPPWTGPRVELGWAHYVLSDGYGGGGVHAFTFGGWLPLRRVRAGAWAELGSRDYRLGQNDLLLRA